MSLRALWAHTSNSLVPHLPFAPTGASAVDSAFVVGHPSNSLIPRAGVVDLCCWLPGPGCPPLPPVPSPARTRLSQARTHWPLSARTCAARHSIRARLIALMFSVLS